MKLKALLPVVSVILLGSCVKDWDKYWDHHHDPSSKENASTFSEISSITIGGEAAAEISAFDPDTKKLFVVNNDGTSRVDILDFSNPLAPILIGNIDITPYGGGVNSVAVSEGKLAAAIQGFDKTDNGKIAVFKTSDYTVIKIVGVGALPDMVTFTYDGKYILSANEGEPNDDYTIDPEGSISIIDIRKGYSVKTLDFNGFAAQQATLMSKGLRVFGPGASFAQDMEPEYVAVSEDSKTAWVTLQENNAVAVVDIRGGTIKKILPLGFKNYDLAKNAMDPSDKDGGVFLNPWNVKGMYLPDAIATIEYKGAPLFFTANEGDSRDYSGFSEEERIKDVTLDPTAFPDAALLQQDANLGRLKITSTLGDEDNDGDYDVLYSYGGRSFSIWNGYTGQQVFDSENELDKVCIDAGVYDDGRSDDKSVEAEGVTLGLVGKKLIAFIGMERSNAVALYDVTNPYQPSFIKLLPAGTAPEGLLFIPASESPSGKSLLVVSSEVSGTVKTFSVD